MILLFTPPLNVRENSLLDTTWAGQWTFWGGESWTRECCENVAAVVATQAARVLRPRGHTNPLEFFRGGGDGGGRNNAWDEVV